MLHALRSTVPAAVVLILTASCGGDDPAAEPDRDPSTAASLNLSEDGTGDGSWTAEEQQAIDAMVAYNDTVASFLQGEKLDMDRMLEVARNPYARKAAKQVSNTTSAGFVMTGQDEYTPTDVTISGDQARVEACWDSSTSTVVNEYQTPPATVEPLPEKLVTYRLARAGDRWVVTGRTTGKGC